MVSLWPFGGQDNSPDAFEKKLSSLATQILDHEKRLIRLRTRGRRIKGLWTLYTLIAWVIYTSILTLVVRLENANIYQIGVLGGSPFVVYVIRQSIKRYYEWRVHNVETSLETYREQQKETIEKLKAVTKYDSTQALLDKYTKTSTTTGAEPNSPPIPQGNGPNQARTEPQPNTPPGTLRKRHGPAQRGQKGNTASPSPSRLQTEQRHDDRPGTPLLHEIPPHELPPHEFPPPEGFAPGIFPPHMMGGIPPVMGGIPMGQYMPPPPEEPRQPQWYDRFLDVLLGEDEMSAKNRYALICSNCRQVNGLAPPGTTNIEDVRYICGRCGAENGKPKVKELIGKVAEEQQQQETADAKTTRSKSKKKSKPAKGDRVVYQDGEDGTTDGEFRGSDSSGSGIEEAVVVKKRKGRPSRQKG
ncbi:uncharacterized protein DFL_003615 [Arthrobotrys flagrans]|uniref:Endoplasmic reticulum junction formation protein lunapark n=1 Tax=Arthrobotrys flagrans TaxID=97331 RepID=A0A437A2C2_ARTFL|nr:hypothetical protein DFL_003615 [Arthrobotrys flagrans]